MSRMDEEKEREPAVSQGRNEEVVLTREQPVDIDPLDFVGSKKDLGKHGFNHSEKDVFRQRTNESSSSSRSESNDDAKAKAKADRPTESWHSKINPLRKRNPPPVPESRRISREKGANFLSLLTFQWINPLMTVGYNRPLELGDIW